MVVVFKAVPSNARALQWRERMLALNGDREFAQRGTRICGELEENFPNLSHGQLGRIAARYGATHYLVAPPRPDLAGALVQAFPGAAIYDLHRVRRR